MARLIFPNGSEERDRAAITAAVAGLGAQLRHLPPPGGAQIDALLAHDQLDEDGQAALLAAVDAHVADWLPPGSHAARDLVEFHAALPGLDELRRKFATIHSHPDDEVRYILSGTGYFGFVTADGSQTLLEVESGDYLNVPRGAEHWFTLGSDPRLKAVRYFATQQEWVAIPSAHRIDPALTPA
ncbi:cupin domain-containing protein [Pseudothauera nasutitermitis]|uniref:acireductone dioxygenase (Fe(2+)-requiring) n=1 Tax=Pseudothauera nasutitermitis TaxID=2565930 RepID=A0A4S4B6C0_9RHOO|nr:cupin domain-containing protein [Pseudothauera nasutitermitis]THF67376.1 cupin domain-containing protein [Pseudothauera nasutitermitis]